ESHPSRCLSLLVRNLEHLGAPTGSSRCTAFVHMSPWLSGDTTEAVTGHGCHHQYAGCLQEVGSQRSSHCLLSATRCWTFMSWAMPSVSHRRRLYRFSVRIAALNHSVARQTWRRTSRGWGAPAGLSAESAVMLK